MQLSKGVSSLALDLHPTSPSRGSKYKKRKKDFGRKNPVEKTREREDATVVKIMLFIA